MKIHIPHDIPKIESVEHFELHKLQLQQKLKIPDTDKYKIRKLIRRLDNTIIEKRKEITKKYFKKEKG